MGTTFTAAAWACRGSSSLVACIAHAVDGPDMLTDAQAQFFALSVDQDDGNRQGYRLVLTWRPKLSAGIGLSLRSGRSYAVMPMGQR